jgi:hypothetical protein
MSSQEIKCSMCGHHYDPDQHLACQSCPMHANCSLVCCPKCGYQTVNQRNSFLVRLTRSLSRHRKRTRYAGKAAGGTTLADVPPGGQAEFAGFSDTFPADRKVYLQAYGLVLNHQVQVVQQSPVTIIRLDQVELAIENDLARGILVNLPPSEGSDHR